MCANFLVGPACNSWGCGDCLGDLVPAAPDTMAIVGLLQYWGMPPGGLAVGSDIPGWCLVAVCW